MDIVFSFSFGSEPVQAVSGLSGLEAPVTELLA